MATDPSLHLPRLSKTESGLIVPSSVAGMGVATATPSMIDLRSPVQAHDETVPWLANVKACLTEDALGATPATLAETKEIARNLPFEASMRMLCRLMAALPHADREPLKELQLAREFYGEEFAKEIGKVLASGEIQLVFAEQHIFTAQRILFEHAQEEGDGSPEADAGTRQLLLAASSIVSEVADEAIAQFTQVEDWLGYFLQNGAYHSIDPPLPNIVRAQLLFGDFASREGESERHDYCPIKEWISDDYNGITLEDHFQIGFVLYALSRALDKDAAPNDRAFVALNAAKKSLQHDLTEPRFETALELLAAERDWFVKEFARLGESPSHLVWDVRPFMQRPFLRLSTGDLLLLAPRALESWLTDGFYYRLLASAQTRSMGQRFTQYFGHLVEDYSVWLMRAAHGELDETLGGRRVLGEQPYAGGEKKTSDIAIDSGPDLVLMEVSGSRLNAESMIFGDKDTVAMNMEHFIGQKIDQLDNCIDALLSGDAELEGVDIRRVQRIWPIVVSVGDATLCEPLWAYLDARHGERLQQPKVQPLTLFDLDDLEQVSYLVEQGKSVHDLVAAKAAAGYARQELRAWLQDDPSAPRVQGHSSAIVERANRMWDRLLRSVQSAG